MFSVTRTVSIVTHRPPTHTKWHTQEKFKIAVKNVMGKFLALKYTNKSHRRTLFERIKDTTEF